MLVLSRKAGESLIIGDAVRVKILDVQGQQVRVGIEAPREIAIVREELHREVAAANRQAARADAASAATLASALLGRGDDGQEKR